MKYMAIIDADKKPISCEFTGIIAPYRAGCIGATTDIKELGQEPNIDMHSEEIKILQKRSYLEGFHEALKMSVKQEPCEDCISREDTLRAIIKHLGIKGEKYLLKAERSIYKVIKNMPSIQPKTGHWIRHETDYGIPLRECSACREWFEWNMPKNNFCPNCGAKMIEPQESEE